MKKKVKIDYNIKIMSENNFQEIWKESLNQLREQYKQENRENEFKLWFNLEYVSDEQNIITAAVASDFMRESMVKRGNIEIIKNKIKEICGAEIEINFQIKNSSVTSEKKSNENENNSAESEKIKTSEKISAEKNQENEKTEFFKHPDLDENFMFETFVPGDNNMYAYQASMAAAKNPGSIYSPILLYGGSGLGKTHLMESIGNYIYNEKRGKIKLLYLSAEALLNEFTLSLTTKTTQKFKNKYRNLDVFLLDDIHFLQGKNALQEEVFYIFDALNQKHAQMVFTCDRPISELKGINERLQTRFSNGIRIDMQPPNYETRKAILLKKMALMNKNISNEIIDFIAANIESNVRDLEGSFKKVIGYEEFMIETGKKITLEIVKQLLQEQINSSSIGNISIEAIQKVVADYYNISFSDIKGKKQTKKIVFPRHVAIYIAREITENSFTEIGSEFGGKDHSTMMTSYKKIDNLIKTDATLNNAIKSMIKEIKAKK